MPNSATPPTYSTSRSGVTMRLSRLRVHVSSSKPGAHRDLRLVDDVPEHDARRAGSPTPSRPASRPTCRRTRRANRTAPRRRAATATRRTAGAGCARARTRAGARSRACAATTAPARVSGCVGDGDGVLMGDRSVGGRRLVVARRDGGTRLRGRRGRSARAIVVGRAVGDDAPVRQEHDAVAHLLDVAHVVARHQQRGAFVVAELEQTGAHALRDVGVERRGRLVEHEQPRPVQRGADDADRACAVPTTARCPSRRRGAAMRNRSRPSSMSGFGSAMP